MKVINLSPENMVDIRNDMAERMFVYSAYLPPGLHNMLIYCPDSETAWAKQFYVGTNKKDFYPELPGCINAG